MQYDLRSQHISLTPIEKLVLAFLLLVALVMVGTTGFLIIGQRSLVDALYLTLVTISTLGMAPSQMADITGGEKIWVIFLIVVGIASAMASITVIISVVVEGQMRSILGRRKVNQKIATLQNHVIVCGYGRMGHSACDNLAQRQALLVAVDNSDAKTAAAEKNGHLYVLGDATDETVLIDAGIERARGLISVLDTDAANVFVTLIARDLNPKIQIVARAEKSESEARLMRAGANKALCPHQIGATRLANILTRPGVVDFIDFASQGLDLEAEQYHIAPENKLNGRSLRQANLPREIGVLIIAIKHADGSTSFNPHPDTVIQSGDVLFVTGQTGSMAKLEQFHT